MNNPSNSLMDAYRPDLIMIEDNLVAAVFSLMKIIPAQFCLQTARQSSIIAPDSVIFETSSGTMALGLAIVCRWYNYKLTIVTDPSCDYLLGRRLKDLGVRVEVVPRPAAVGGFQRARLDRLNELRMESPNSWWVNQYDNPANAEAYRSFAEQLLKEVGRIDCFVGTVGSGGSICGTARYLRKVYPDLQVIGVDTFGSVLFGQPDKPRKLRGLGNSLLPKNLDHTIFDEVHWVSAAEAFTATRMLHRQTTLFRGGTSGACWLVARYLAAKKKRARVVCLFPDDGNRYIETIYNDEYLRQNELLLDQLPTGPEKVEYPSEANCNWSFIEWARRPYREVIGSISARTISV